MSQRFFKSLSCDFFGFANAFFLCLYGILVWFEDNLCWTNPHVSILRPTDLQDSTSAIWTLRCPVNLRHMRHQIPKHSQLPKRRCPWETGSILVVCVFWRYIVIRLFDRDVDEDSDKISATCPCSFPVAQGTYYWNPQKYQKHQKRSRGPVISSIVARVYSVHLGTISESCGNSQASVSFVYPEVEEVLNRSSTLLFMKGSPEMPRCRFSRLATWRQWRRISTMEMLQYLSICWGYLGFTGEYGEPRRGQEFQWISQVGENAAWACANEQMFFRHTPSVVQIIRFGEAAKAVEILQQHQVEFDFVDVLEHPSLRLVRPISSNWDLDKCSTQKLANWHSFKLLALCGVVLQAIPSQQYVMHSSRSGFAPSFRGVFCCAAPRKFDFL